MTVSQKLSAECLEKDPYIAFEANPDSAVRDFRYKEGLFLRRLKEAPKRGAGSKKVRFIVSEDYTALWSTKDMTGRKDCDPDWVEVTVPKGYLTDFASVPWYGRVLVSRIGPWAEASVIHDYLCDAWKWQGGNWDFARRCWSDQLMNVAMARTDAGWARHVIFVAVSLYGYWQWVQNRFGFAKPVHRDRASYFEDLGSDESRP